MSTCGGEILSALWASPEGKQATRSPAYFVAEYRPLIRIRTAPKSRISKGEEGELSIFATEIVLLTPCLHALPDEYYGFKNHEERHRKRYLDLIMNDSTRGAIIQRSRYACSPTNPQRLHSPR